MLLECDEKYNYPYKINNRGCLGATISKCPAQFSLIMAARGSMEHHGYSPNFSTTLSFNGIATKPQEDELCPTESEMNWKS